MFKNSSAETCPEIRRNFHIWKNLQYVLPNYLAFLQVKATLGFAAVPIMCYIQGESAVLSFPVYSTVCASSYGTCLCSQCYIENLSNQKSTFSPSVCVFPVGSHGKQAEFYPGRLQDFFPFFSCTPLHQSIQKHSFSFFLKLLFIRNQCKSYTAPIQIFSSLIFFLKKRLNYTIFLKFCFL